MPNGRTHALATVIVAAGAALSGQDPSLVVGCLTGVLIHPDLDQAESRKGMWYGFWKIYGYMFKHRGVSHYPIIGTITRLIYMFLPLAAIASLIKFTLIPDTGFIPWVTGLMIVDTVHALMDVVQTTVKRVL